MKIEDLPIALMHHCCTQKHYLTLTRDPEGTWSLGYVNFIDGHPMLMQNGSVDINEAITRMAAALKRRVKRYAQGLETE